MSKEDVDSMVDMFFDLIDQAVPAPPLHTLPLTLRL